MVGGVGGGSGRTTNHKGLIKQIIYTVVGEYNTKCIGFNPSTLRADSKANDGYCKSWKYHAFTQ